MFLDFRYLQQFLALVYSFQNSLFLNFIYNYYHNIKCT